MLLRANLRRPRKRRTNFFNIVCYLIVRFMSSCCILCVLFIYTIVGSTVLKEQYLFDDAKTSMMMLRHQSSRKEIEQKSDCQCYLVSI